MAATIEDAATIPKINGSDNGDASLTLVDNNTVDGTVNNISVNNDDNNDNDNDSDDNDNEKNNGTDAMELGDTMSSEQNPTATPLPPPQGSDSSEQQQPGLFARLFGLKNQKPSETIPGYTIANGTRDLLDDHDHDEDLGRDSDQASEEGEDTDEENNEDTDDDDNSHANNNNSDQETLKGVRNDTRVVDGDEVEWESDNDEGKDKYAVSDDDDFGDFRRAPPKAGEESEDENEMMSLIGGGANPASSNNNAKVGGLGASLTRFFGVKPEAPKERKSLLANVGDETDEDEEDKDDLDRIPQNSPLNRAPSGAYYDAHESDDDVENDGPPEEGEYRLDSFYPSDSCAQEYPDTYIGNRKDLYGRIQGFGSESALQLTMDGSVSSRFYGDARMYDVPMSSMDVETSHERGGILNEVGKAVSNITQLILQKRPGAVDQAEERRKMLSYIAQLEHKLEEKERELQSWKERAEQLQLEVHWLRESANGEDEDENDDEESDEPGSSEENGDTTNTETAGAVVVQEGQLIDVTAKAPVFDPLLETTAEPVAPKVVVDEDLFEAFRDYTNTSKEETQVGDIKEAPGQLTDTAAVPTIAMVNSKPDEKQNGQHVEAEC